MPIGQVEWGCRAIARLNPHPWSTALVSSTAARHTRLPNVHPYDVHIPAVHSHDLRTFDIAPAPGGRADRPPAYPTSEATTDS